MADKMKEFHAVSNLKKSMQKNWNKNVTIILLYLNSQSKLTWPIVNKSLKYFSVLHTISVNFTFLLYSNAFSHQLLHSLIVLSTVEVGEGQDGSVHSQGHAVRVRLEPITAKTAGWETQGLLRHADFCMNTITCLGFIPVNNFQMHLFFFLLNAVWYNNEAIVEIQSLF